jgi:hypothetical protein
MSRLLNTPPGMLVDRERIARFAQERTDAEHRMKHFDDHGNELSPRLTTSPADIDEDDLFYHAKGVRTVLGCTALGV